jgi:hypothetical protein
VRRRPTVAERPAVLDGVGVENVERRSVAVAPLRDVALVLTHRDARVAKREPRKSRAAVECHHRILSNETRGEVVDAPSKSAPAVAAASDDGGLARQIISVV